MAQLDTLEVYERLIAGGFSSEQAHAQVKSFDTAFHRILRDFASNKIITILGSVITIFAAAILAVGSFTLYKIWDVSIDLTQMNIRMSSLESKVNKLEDDFHNFIKR
jgi:hypothetical protein